MNCLTHGVVINLNFKQISISVEKKDAINLEVVYIIFSRF